VQYPFDKRVKSLDVILTRYSESFILLLHDPHPEETVHQLRNMKLKLVHPQFKRHKWKDDICVHCGVVRVKKNWTQVIGTRSILRHGVFEDVPVHKIGRDFWYSNNGNEYGFERPNCLIYDDIKATGSHEDDRKVS
jgi:hypothetical protein